MAPRAGAGNVRLISRILGRQAARAGGYIAAGPTLAAARAAGQTVEEYVETLWGGVGGTAAIVERMRAAGALEAADTVVEIGPGTGRYLIRVRELVRPRRHVIFETAADWREWLVGEYGVEAPASDGEHLAVVDAAELLHAHGVFVYTPMLVTASYLAEIERVATRWVVFDYLDLEDFDDAAIAVWLASPDRYPVPLTRSWILARLPNFELLDEWSAPYGHGQSRYLVLRRQR